MDHIHWISYCSRLQHALHANCSLILHPHSAFPFSVWITHTRIRAHSHTRSYVRRTWESAWDRTSNFNKCCKHVTSSCVYGWLHRRHRRRRHRLRANIDSKSFYKIQTGYCQWRQANHLPQIDFALSTIFCSPCPRAQDTSIHTCKTSDNTFVAHMAYW